MPKVVNFDGTTRTADVVNMAGNRHISQVSASGIEEMLEAIEDLQDRVEAGDVAGFIAIIQHSDECTSSMYAGRTAGRSMLGLLTIAMTRMGIKLDAD